MTIASKIIKKIKNYRYEKKIFLKLGFFALAIFLVWITFESTYKLINYFKNKKPRIQETCRIKDPVIFHSFIPDSQCTYASEESGEINYKINSAGFRDYEYTLEKPRGAFRIIILGDSFTEGVKVNLEDTYGKILESNLNDRGINVEVIQMAIAGWSPFVEYLALLTRGLDYSPDLVIFTTNISDFKDEYFFEGYLTEEGRKLLSENDIDENYFKKDVQIFKIENNPPTKTISFKRFLTENFYTFKLLETLKRNLELRKVNLAQVNQFSVTFDEKPDDYDEALGKIKVTIMRTKSVLDKNNIDLLIMPIPTGHVISGDQWSIGREQIGLKVGKVYSNRATEDLLAWARSQNIETFNPSEALKTHSSEQKLYFEEDVHFNAKGHRVVADALFDYLFRKVIN